jgi:hypothetical protein
VADPGDTARRWPASLLVGSTAGIAFLLAASRPVATNDLSIYVAMGRWMLLHRAFLDHDVFTYTVAGQPFLDGTWGFALLSAEMDALVGTDGIRFLFALSVAATCVLVARVARRAGAAPGASAVASLYAWLLLLQNTAPRGQTLCFLLFLAFQALVARPPPAWLGVILAALVGATWASLHGSFPVACFFALAVAAGAIVERRRLRASLPALLLLGGLLAGTFVGPLGPAILSYIGQNIALPSDRGLTEWAPPQLFAFDGARLALAFALWLVLIARAFVAWRRKPLVAAAGGDRTFPLPPADILVLLGFSALALSGTRFIAWFGLATAVPLARALSLPSREESAARPAIAGPLASRRVRGLVSVALGAAWLGMLLHGTKLAMPLADDTPVAAVDALARASTGARVFSAFEHAGYLAERLGAPGCAGDGTSTATECSCFPYFLDMRVWIYDDATWSRFLRIARAEPGWQDALDQDRVDFLLLSRRHQGSALLEAAGASEAWRVLSDDGSNVLLGRSGAGS